MDYYFEDNHFVIENYDKKKTFSSFLPGIAGVKGIPLWTFYANRGQGITSFGIRDKDEPIQEFFPANTSYQYVDRYGFRSFVRVDGTVYEPFAVNTSDVVSRKMRLSRGHFSIEETNQTRMVQYKVTYFGLTNEPLAGLVRQVEITNLGSDRAIEVLDGLANILPSGATNEGYKQMSNLMVSWMGIENLENHIPFYKFRASSGDEAEVSLSKKGHFYLSFTTDETLIKPIVDLNLIFGYDTSLTIPVAFANSQLFDLDLDNQVLVNKVPCGITPVSLYLSAGDTTGIYTIIGHASDVSVVNEKALTYANKAFIEKKLSDAEAVIDDLVKVVETHTCFPIFDAYIKQNFLDNTLRGGFPLVFGEGEDPKIYHVYSRKHGDPERDYNFFTLAPEFYSQGNGNFRDVNQNRRNDVYFVPEAGLFNVKMFMNLIQLDGYNPLGVQGTTFSIDQAQAEALIETFVVSGSQVLRDAFTDKFTPGKISMLISLHQVLLSVDDETFIHQVLDVSTQHIEAVFGEGFWSDHWTYNFDLIESYLSVFPDQLEAILYEDSTYRYFDSPVSVLPRLKKYGLTESGLVRQYGSIEEEPHSERFSQSNWKRDVSGKIVETNLVQKLMTLIMTKFSTLDPFGLGIEMEANKPGWNDAMNGLPGVFGSGLSETVELIRVVAFLKAHLTKDVVLFEENYTLFSDLMRILYKPLTQFQCWDMMSTVRETFREIIKNNISGKVVVVSKSEVITFLIAVEKVLNDGIERAKTRNGGLIPTYLTYEASDYDVLDEVTPYGLKAVKVNAFELHQIPNFLEAPARSLKIGTVEENQKLHALIKQSDLYDSVFKTYKTCEPLDTMRFELGRIRAFTPGWLERESNFLHMTFKYLLGLLKGGLYDAFFEEVKTNLVCFMDPSIYGRSTLENSSFIASSRNPNPSVHGQGFVSRLSGSTAEMLSIWNYMMFGESIFKYEDTLVFSPEPILHVDFFLEGRVKATLLSQIEFIIENKTAFSTYSEKIKVDYFVIDGQKFDEVKGEIAYKIRNRQVKQIIMVYKLN